MAIEPGKRFGPYEVVEQIGVGGMGEVYRATDTSLKRDVAIKILPESFAKDADRLARFRREAEVLASLNHSNIAQIYGLERADGETVIVMELVEGPTLADRIAEGPIAPDEALGIAQQIADALEAAHGLQIVHRDLKPQNIKLKPDGTIKVLDFGIAKATDLQAISGGPAPVMTTPAVTQTGVILGTAAYMSPEQARGKPVDQRTDIWAFGCLLFEMLTGQTAFGAEDVMLTLARVLDRDTDLSSMPGTVSPAVRHTIKLCLEKDPRKRISDIRDVRLALEGLFETEVPRGAQLEGARAGAGRRLLIPAIAAAGLLAGTGAWFLKPAPEAERDIVTRFDVAFPEGVTLRNPVTSVLDIAPNGEYFVFNGSDAIYVRDMGDTQARPVSGTGGTVVGLAISPDSEEVAYFRLEGSVQLTKIAVDGGAPIVIADQLSNPYGLSWEADGTILYGQQDGIWRVSDNGGTPEKVISVESGQAVYGPQLLPGGEWVLFTFTAGSGGTRWDAADIVVQSLVTGERRVLRAGGMDGRYLPSGHIVYVFDNVLFASAFDPASLTLDDERVSLVQGVETAVPIIGGSAFYSIAGNGTLIFIPGNGIAGAAGLRRSLLWVDREGNTERVPVRPGNYTMARISPDGRKVALVVGSTLPVSDPAPDIYIFDLETENLTQLTFDVAPDDGPVWSRDGSRIFFRTYRENGTGAVYAIPAEGGVPELVAHSPDRENPLPWSAAPDGETLLLVDALSLEDVDIAMLEIGEADELTPLFDNDGLVTEPVLSPNGEWMAVAEVASLTNAGQDTEINIRPFPGVRQQRRPVAPGTHPVFSADGSELIFFDGAGLSSASIEYSPFRIGAPQTLFRGQYWYGVAGPDGGLGRAWDADPLNDRFLMLSMPETDMGTEGAQGRPRINIVLNWDEELLERVPRP